jgi:hypothetical protein
MFSMTEKRVDESWKEQIKKEQVNPQPLKKDSPQAKAEPVAEPAGEQPEQPAENAAHEMPPADFNMFISSLGLQALMALGEIENPITNKRDPDRAQAQYLIDTIGMLQEKTKGNLTAEEQNVIEQMLYELRMKFVGVNK